MLQWEDLEHTVFNSQSSMKQIIAKIDFEVNSESRLRHSVEEEDDSNQEANQAQWQKPSVQQHCSWKRSALIDSHAFQGMVHCLSESQKSAALSQVKAEGFECHSTWSSFLRGSWCSWEAQSAHVCRDNHFSVRSSHSPGLVSKSGSNQSTQEVHCCQWIDSLSLLFNVMVIQESSTSRTSRSWHVTTQVSPPYSHQGQGAVESFHKTLYGPVRAIKIGLADQLGLHSDQVEGSLLPWIVQHAVYQSNRYLIRSDGRTSSKRCSTNLRSHQSSISESVFSLTVSLSALLETCRSSQHLRSHLEYGWERILSQACT